MPTADPYNDDLSDEIYDLFITAGATVATSYIARIPYIGIPLAVALGVAQMGEKTEVAKNFYTELTTSSQDRPAPFVANYSFWLSQGVRYYP
jgi:hypothetical protein